MNEIINKVLLVGDKFMPAMHLKQPAFTYSACGPFTKNKERNTNINKNFFYRNKLDQACFQRDMAYGKCKDLIKRAHSDNVLKDKAFKIANNPNYDGYQRRLVSMIISFLIKSPLCLINPKEVILLMNQIINWQMNFINQLLENLKKE